MLTEAEFYNQLAEFFDVMTDWNSRLSVELPFIEKVFAAHRVHSVLDSACGTGGHSLALAQRGYRVAGADISAAMIARANANAERAGLRIPFAVASFQDLPATFTEKFDAVVCLGNSLVHVLTDDALADSLASMRACLRDGGVLILHNLNYDKRWKEKPRWFAVNAGQLANRETLVWRFADYYELPITNRASQETSRTSQITFNIALFTRGENGTWSVQVQSTPQRPYQKAEVEEFLRRAGFQHLEFYGNLQGDAFDAERSGDLVIVATV